MRPIDRGLGLNVFPAIRNNTLRSRLSAIAVAAGLAVSAPALAVDNSAAGYAGTATGNWSGGGTNVTGMPDGSCANMGANGKANFLSNFGFNIPGTATINGITAFARAGTANDENVIFQLASDVTAPTFLGTTQVQVLTGAGGGACATAVGVQYPATTTNNLGGWGIVGSVAPATVNSANFGIGLTTDSNGTVKFDSLCLQVAYVTAAGPAVQQACLTSDAVPELTLDKTSPTADYDSVGDILVYSYLVSNTGTAPLAFPVTVSDNRAVVTCPADDGGAPNNGDAILDPGESITCAASYSVVQADLNAGSVTNTATASAAGTLSNQDQVTINAVQNPLLTVVKSSTTAQVTETGNVSYSYLVTNTGNITLTGIALSDDNDNDDMSCPATTLAPNANMTCTATHTVTQAEINQNGSPAPDSGFLSNTVTATSNEAPTAQDTLDIPIAQNRSLVVTKTGVWNDEGATPNIAEVGETVSYTISVLNDGNTDEILIDVTDPLITGAPNNGTISCPGGNPIPILTVGSPALDCTGTYTLVLADINAGQVDNTAAATAFEGTTDNDSETVNLPSALGLSLVKTGTFNDDTTADGFAEAGETIGYTFEVTNDSSVTVTGISVTDPKVSPITCPSGNPIPSLGPGASETCTGTYTLLQADVDAGQVDNTAQASSADVPDPASDDETVVLNQNTAWTITKSGVFQDESGDGFAQVGETIEYTLSIENTGFVTLTNLAVTDPKVAPVTCPSGNPIPSLDPGATEDCTGSYAITQADINAGQVSNTGTGNPDQTPSQDDIFDLPLAVDAGMTIEKMSATTLISGPGPVLYSYLVTNTGGATLTNIQLSDDNDDDDLSCPETSLDPAGSMLCTATRTVVQADIDANGSPTPDSGILENTVTGTADELGETEITDTLQIDMEYNPVLTVAKDANVAEVNGEGVVEYSYLVRNLGNVTLTGIALVDDNVDGPVDCGGITELVPGETGTMVCTAQHTVTLEELQANGSPVAGSGEVFNSVSATSNEAPEATDELAIPINYIGLLSIEVTKDFSDDNPAEVEVQLTCDTGLPLIQTFTISEGNPVKFVVEAYAPGEISCQVEEISETSTGYTASYNASAIEGVADAVRSEEDGCYYDLVQTGSFACELTNVLDPVEVMVTKEWVGDVEQIDAAVGLYASADWTCYDVLDGPDGLPGSIGGTLYFEGTLSNQAIGGLYPWWDGNPRCVVSEGTVDSSVEADDSDCESVSIAPGMGGNCTITNTMFFEGIPTLSRTGLAIMALLMLAAGMVGFRRFV